MRRAAETWRDAADGRIDVLGAHRLVRYRHRPGHFARGDGGFQLITLDQPDLGMRKAAHGADSRRLVACRCRPPTGREVIDPEPRQVVAFPAVALSSLLGGVVRRREDRRLTTGAGTFTDDVALDGCLHAVFVRSPHAHARIASVEAGAALRIPGVVGGFQAADLVFESETARPRLSSVEVKFVGDAVAVVVAEGRGEAVDAAASVIVDYDVLPALVDSMIALQPGAIQVPADQDDNLAFDFDIGEEGALEGSDVVVRARFVNQRLTAGAHQTHAVGAEPSGEGGIRLWTSTQVPVRVRAQCAGAPGPPEDKVRVIAGDVGGGFRAQRMTHPEQSGIARLAMK